MYPVLEWINRTLRYHSRDSSHILVDAYRASQDERVDYTMLMNAPDYGNRYQVGIRGVIVSKEIIRG